MNESDQPGTKKELFYRNLSILACLVPNDSQNFEKCNQLAKETKEPITEITIDTAERVNTQQLEKIVKSFSDPFRLCIKKVLNEEIDGTNLNIFINEMHGGKVIGTKINTQFGGEAIHCEIENKKGGTTSSCKINNQQ